MSNSCRKAIMVKCRSKFVWIPAVLLIAGISASVFQVDPVSQARSEPVYDFPFTLEKNSNLFQSLRSHGVDPLDIHDIVRAAKPYRDLASLRSGTRYQFVFGPGPVEQFTGIRFQFSPAEYLEVRNEGADLWNAFEVHERIDTQLMSFSGEVESSLWESAKNASMDPNLIADLSEIFAWQVDFTREVHARDRWRLTVEQKRVRGKFIGWGRILAAEYENAGQLFTAVLYQKDKEDFGYFFPDGSSMRRMFLKSPLRYSRISSRFQRNRFHPILKFARPHLGVDYAAATGTPVRAVGDGVISFLGRQGGGGKTIKLKHNSTYATAYKHLNGFASGLRSGSRVQQGQIIGYVGSTGLSTGPHLHFEFYENGRYLDPLSKKFPSADPIRKDLMAEFKATTSRQLALLPEWYQAGITPKGPIRVVAADASRHKADKPGDLN